MPIKAFQKSLCAAQIVFAIIICLLGIKFYSYCEPFIEDMDDHMAEAAQ